MANKVMITMVKMELEMKTVMVTMEITTVIITAPNTQRAPCIHQALTVLSTL